MIEAYAPGRAEFLGNHTDYNEGLVLALAINSGTLLTGQTRSDNCILIRSENLAESIEISLSRLHPVPSPMWANYVLGMTAILLRRGADLGGFEITIRSTLPMGAGLGSSASLSVATGLFLQEAFGLKINKKDLAYIAREVEEEFCGVLCGLQDPMTCLLSSSGSMTFIDCRTHEVDYIPLPRSVVFVIANSGVKHALASAPYNERRADCEEAAGALHARFLRDVSISQLESARSRLSRRLYLRASHIIRENDRVIEAVTALRAGDVTRLGELMLVSHASSSLNFENSCPQLDHLVQVAHKIPGCLGARLSGGGFGGVTINLVQKLAIDSFLAEMRSCCPDAELIVTGAEGGAWARHRDI
jgi:galactokinase